MANQAHASDPYAWGPVPLKTVADLFSAFAGAWWIAGGHAIELFVGKPLRPHGDIDVLICRSDQLRVQEHLADWDLHHATYPGLRHWARGERLEGRYRDIWCRQGPEERWALQIMLLDTDGNEWVFKRDPSIRGNLAQIGNLTPEGIPYLRPEIQLLYKAKAEILKKDQVDFDAAAPLLGASAHEWLLDVLVGRFPQGHSWITALRELLARPA